MMKRLAAGLAALGVCFSAVCQQVIPTVNVRQFGARGNGVADDTAAIDSALSTLTTNNPVLYFPAGNYKRTTTLTMPTFKGWSIVGAGRFNTRILYSGNSDAIYVGASLGNSAQLHAVIPDISIVADGSGSGANGLHIANCYKVQVLNAGATGFGNAGFLVDPLQVSDQVGIIQFTGIYTTGNKYGLKVGHTSNNIHDVRVDGDSDFDGNSNYNLWAWANAFGFDINGSVFYLSANTSTTNIYVDSIGGGIIHGNYIEGGLSSVVLANSGGSTVPPAGVSIDGNGFQGSHTNATAIQLGISASDHLNAVGVRNNWMSGFTNGVQFVGIVNNSLIGPNYFSGTVTNRYNALVTGSTATVFDQNNLWPGLRIGTNGTLNIYDSSSQAIVQIEGQKEFSIFDNVASASRFLIKTNGNTGIGTASPTALLSINGTADVKGLTNLSGVFDIQGGIAGSVATPGMRVKNNRIITFRDPNDADTLAGFLWMKTDNTFGMYNANSSSKGFSIDTNGDITVTGGNVALQNNKFLQAKDAGGTLESNTAIDSGNNLVFNSPTSGGGHRYTIRKGDQTAKWQFGAGLVSPLTLSSNLAAVTAALTASGGATVTGGITNNGAAGAKGTLDIFATNSSSFLRLQTPDKVTTYTLTLPGTNVSGYLYNPADGNPAQWTSLSGTPGGSDTYVQFNDGGSFGGDAGFKYSKSTKVLTLTNLVASLPVYTDGLKGLTNNLVTGVGATVQSNVPSIYAPTLYTAQIHEPDVLGVINMHVGDSSEEPQITFLGSTGSQTNRDWAIYPILDSSGTNYTFRIATYAATAGTTNQPAIDITRVNTNITSIKFWAPIDAPNVTGSGNFMRTRVGVVRSIDLPMGAWFTNGIAAPAAPASWTNAADSFQFADGVTNTLRIRFPLPLNWNAGVVRAQFVMGSTLTNATTSTNVVFGIKGATILGGGTEDSLTFGTQVTVTNHVHRSPYVSTICTTSDITVGNTPAANKDIVWELTRMTSDSVDVNTNTVSVLDAQFFYTETATEPSMPASTN